MYLKKEITISFFIITISASNLYMPMIWLYIFLQDFLIPFLCDPDLQCKSPNQNPHSLKVPKCEIFHRLDFHDFYTIKPFWVTLGLKYKLVTLILGGARHPLISDAHAECTLQFLTCTLSTRISSWPVCSWYASIPDAYAQHVLQGLRSQRAICICSLHTPAPDSYTQRTHQFLTRTLRCAWVPDPYAQRAHKGRIMRVRNSNLSVIFKVPKTAKILKNPYWHQLMVSKEFWKKFFLAQTKINASLKLYWAYA